MSSLSRSCRSHASMMACFTKMCIKPGSSSSDSLGGKEEGEGGGEGGHVGEPACHLCPILAISTLTRAFSLVCPALAVKIPTRAFKCCPPQPAPSRTHLHATSAPSLLSKYSRTVMRAANLNSVTLCTCDVPLPLLITLLATDQVDGSWAKMPWALVCECVCVCGGGIRVLSKEPPGAGLRVCVCVGGVRTTGYCS